LKASTSRDIDAAFAKAVELKVGALVIGADPYFDSHLDKFAALATRFAMPTIAAKCQKETHAPQQTIGIIGACTAESSPAIVAG
jgi:hypothetical protein